VRIAANDASVQTDGMIGDEADASAGSVRTASSLADAGVGSANAAKNPHSVARSAFAPTSTKGPATPVANADRESRAPSTRATLGDLPEPSADEIDEMNEAFENADPQVRKLFEQQMAAAKNLRASRKAGGSIDPPSTPASSALPVDPPVTVATNIPTNTVAAADSTAPESSATAPAASAADASPLAHAKLAMPVPPANPRAHPGPINATTQSDVPARSAAVPGLAAIAAAHRSVSSGDLPNAAVPVATTSPLADSRSAAPPATPVAAAQIPASTGTTAAAEPPKDSAQLLAELAARADEIAAASDDPTGLRPLIQERLALMLAGQFDQATAPVAGLQPAEQQYVQQQLAALRALLDPAGSPVRERRWSDALGQLRPAVNQLAAATGRLEVRGTQFCTAVESFGRVTAFPKYEFQPGQQVILYCEVDSFTALQTKEGYETELRGEYSIYNDKDVRVADQELPVDQQTCANYRRDYFIAYRLYLPKRLEPGSYRLQLTIEDGKSERYGQATVPFTIVAK
jgi:hypothetical protein